MHRYANENIPLSVVEVLRQLGHHVLTTVNSHGRNIGATRVAWSAFATSNQPVAIGQIKLCE